MSRRKSMRQIRECLRLYFVAKLSYRQIGRTVKIGHSSVQDYVSRLKVSGCSYEESVTLSDKDLETLLYPSEVASQSTSQAPLPDFSALHIERKKPGVTTRLLWQEYIADHPDGLRYSQFCWHYQQWRKGLKTSMHMEHKGGEKVFVDYSGDRMEIVDRETGEVRKVEIFVMCWGASQYLYAEAHPSQQLEDWIMGHVRGFEFFGKIPEIIVPDNLKSAVNKACKYDPEINRSYQEFSEHYGCAIVPARPYKPKDKGKVENGVRLVQQWLLAPLRNQIFHTLEELNTALHERLIESNSRPMQKIKKSRKELFDEVDFPYARELPQKRYTFAQWYTPTIAPDYHIQVEKSFYSVPYELYGKTLDVRVSGRSVEIFCGLQRIASHLKSTKEYNYVTTLKHLPESQQHIHSLSLESLCFKARSYGPKTEELIKKVISQKIHPLQGFRPAQGILRLAKKFSPERLEEASKIALRFGLTRVAEIEGVIKTGFQRAQKEEVKTIRNESNVRGATYYAGEQEG